MKNNIRLICLMCILLTLVGCNRKNDKNVSSGFHSDFGSSSLNSQFQSSSVDIAENAASSKTQAKETETKGGASSSHSLQQVTFDGKAGDILLDFTNYSITIPVNADVNLSGKLPVLKTSAGYTANLTAEGGSDLNSNLVYTVSNGKEIEKWRVTTLEVYDGIKEAAVLSTMSVFSENMVLQREVPVKIWGTCIGAQMVTAEFAGQKKRTPVTNNKWEVVFNPLPANSQTQTLTVKTSGQTREIENITIGDVWLCSGQSNMEAQIGALSEANQKDYAPYQNNKNIKYFRVNRSYSIDPLSEFTQSCNWVSPSEWGINEFSAYAYAFALRLESQLNIPIGIIESSFGGTLIEFWMSDKALKSAGTSINGSGYNSMIHPIAGLGIKGILWYQGESNSQKQTSYERLFNEYAKLYREIFRNQNLPIITTQLPKYNDPYFPEWHKFRLRQWNIAESTKNVYCVCGIDLGDANNIHPQDKFPFGSRAGDLTLNKIYAKNTPGINPYPSKSVLSGNKVIITFKNVDKGLEIRHNTISEMYILKEDGSRVLATGTVTSADTIEVSAEGVNSPKGVQYCFSMCPNGNLYDKNGLPAAPFNLKLC